MIMLDCCFAPNTSFKDERRRGLSGREKATLALAAGVVLSRGALKERLVSVQGGAAEQAAKTAEMLEKQEARFALLDKNASYIGLAAIAAGLLHLIAGRSAII